MIESITLRDVASYSADYNTVIDTNKRINLIYGHNGTGKSTIANYVQAPDEVDYFSCSHHYLGDRPEVLVYNQRFIEKNFYEGNQPGIFTLSEGNKDAEIAIEEGEKAILDLSIEQGLITEQGKKLKNTQDQENTKLKEKIWEAKSKYERTPLDFCLDGFKGNKDRFLDQVRQASPDELNINTDNQLIAEASELQNQTDIEIPNVIRVSFDVVLIEDNKIYQEIIAGSKDSYLSHLIQQLENSDWVKDGRVYLEKHKDDCPFCQQPLQPSFENALRLLFDEVYENKISILNSLYYEYKSSIENLKNTLNSECFKSNYVTADNSFKLAKIELFDQLKSNLELIQRKITLPSLPIQLFNTNSLIQRLNDCIDSISEKIISFNDRIRNKKIHLGKIKIRFWSMIRAQYNGAITLTDEKVAKIEDELKNKRDELAKIKLNITEKRSLIAENRAKITNIDLSIVSINSAIEGLGLQGFRIEKEDENPNHYRIVRESQSKKSIKLLVKVKKHS
jgi:hypothetical protein